MTLLIRGDQILTKDSLYSAQMLPGVNLNTFCLGEKVI